MNVLSTKQLIIIIILVPLVYKMATLPALLFSIAGTSCYVSILIIALIEFLQLFVILTIVNNGGLNGIKEKFGVCVGCIITLPLLFVFAFKLVLYVAETFTYIQHFMFYNIIPSPIICTFLIVAGYLAFKGIKTIGRLFEIVIWLIPIIFLLGFAFGEADVKFEYVQSALDKGFLPVASSIKTYLIYTFDFTPLLFIKLDNKKHGHLKIGIASIFSIAILVSCYMIFVAVHGRAAFLVNEAFASLATFNTVVSDIGNLEWPAGLAWISTSLFSVGIMLFGVGEIATTLKIKRQIGIAVYCVFTALISIFVFTKVKEFLKFVTFPWQLAIFIIEIGVPIIFLILSLIKVKEKKHEEPQN